MSKQYSPLTVCDHDCAGANNCTMGGVQCPDCGCWYCPVSDDYDEEGRCDDCAERHRRELEQEELEEQELQKMKAYKGFRKDMTCLGFQYKEGETYTTDKAKVCDCGFHACENPLDCFAYYPPSEGSIFHEVELGGDIQRDDDDTKCAATKIRIGARVTLTGMIKAGLDFVFAKVKESKTPATSGDLSTAATSGDLSTAATSGYLSTAATSGYLSTAEVHGKESVAVVTGLDSKARGCVGSWLVLTERDENWHILGIKAICVDGKKYYADTWYTLKDGKVVEVVE